MTVHTTRQTDDGTTVQATAKDDLHAVISLIAEDAESVADQLAAMEKPQPRVNKQRSYVSFLEDVKMGPKHDFDNPTGTGHGLPNKTTDYRETFGVVCPKLDTVGDEELAGSLHGGEITTLFEEDIPTVEEYPRPVSQTTGKAIPVVPDDLDRAKAIVKQVVTDVREDAGKWFRAMNGADVDLSVKGTPAVANEEPKESDYCEAIQTLHDVKGVGKSLADRIAVEITKRDEPLVLDPEETNCEVSIGDKYDSSDEYMLENGPGAWDELSDEEKMDILQE
jgi:hypothetical protein